MMWSRFLRRPRGCQYAAWFREQARKYSDHDFVLDDYIADKFEDAVGLIFSFTRKGYNAGVYYDQAPRWTLSKCEKIQIRRDMDQGSPRDRFEWLYFVLERFFIPLVTRRCAEIIDGIHDETEAGAVLRYSVGKIEAAILRCERLQDEELLAEDDEWIVGDHSDDACDYDLARHLDATND